jgi:hypothetical protein
MASPITASEPVDMPTTSLSSKTSKFADPSIRIMRWIRLSRVFP